MKLLLKIAAEQWGNWTNPMWTMPQTFRSAYTPDLSWFRFTYFPDFFLIATLKKLPPKVVRWKQIIKIIGTALLFLPSCHSPRVYSNGTGNWSKILVAMFSSSCLKPMDVVKVLQNTSNPAHLHCDVCQGFGACSACLWESSRKEILLGA